uniref:C2 domain-containing protein n=1 Tax=Timema bartmani TaxID=61472 RepID=A0A7R9EVX5_9NEOP|nr:unnamed protein product [Timema bartmani]
MADYITVGNANTPTDAEVVALFQTLPGFEQCDEFDAREWFESDGNDPGYQHLNDDEIVHQVIEDNDNGSNVRKSADDEKMDAEKAAGPSHSDAYEAFQTAMNWLERQPEGTATQLVLLKRLRDMAAKKRTNDAFVTITLGKLKFQTSVKEKSPPDVDWNEECELLIPKQGNTAEVVLTVLHRNFLAVDEFLGVLNIPLKDFDVYERPRIRWYPLQNKPGKEKTKPRGELEVRIGFIVKAGSLIDLSKKEKNKSSLGHLSQMASSVGLKIGRKDKKGKADSLNVGSSITQTSFQKAGDADPGVLSEGESEDEFAFDDLSHDSSASSLNAQTTPAVPKIGSLENLRGVELLHKSSKSPSTGLSTPPVKNKLRSSDHVLGTEPLNRRSWEGTRLTLSSQPEEEEPQEEFGRHNSSRPSKPHQSLDNIYDTSSSFASGNATDKEKKSFTKNLKSVRIGTIPEVVGADDQVHLVENNIKSKLMEADTKSKNLSNKSNNMDKPIEEMNREELFVVISDLQKTVASQNKKMKELENYLDNLLLRVMETTPRLLQNPYVKKSESKYRFKLVLGLCDVFPELCMFYLSQTSEDPGSLSCWTSILPRQTTRLVVYCKYGDNLTVDQVQGTTHIFEGNTFRNTCKYIRAPNRLKSEFPKEIVH